MRNGHKRRHRTHERHLRQRRKAHYHGEDPEVTPPSDAEQSVLEGPDDPDDPVLQRGPHENGGGAPPPENP